VAGLLPAARAVGRMADRLRGVGRPPRFPFGPPSWPDGVPRPAPRRGLGDDYDAGWARRLPVRLARVLVTDGVTRPAVHLVASPTVRDAERLSLVEEPVLLVANHASHLDTPLLLSVLPTGMRHRTVVAAAADHFFDRRWKAHLWAGLLNAIPIERQRVSRRSADTAAELVEAGWNLIIFPEGGRSEDGWQQPFRGGAAYLAVRTGRPVVPVHLAGTHRLLPKGGNRLRRGTTTVTFGTPLRPEPDEDARRFGRRIEQAVAALAAEQRTDWWTARRLAAAGQAQPLAAGPDAAPWRRAWQHGGRSDDDPGRWAVRR
jgi:1-acyl-sn-glycerol-3-phosphate acyltransferase